MDHKLQLKELLLIHNLTQREAAALISSQSLRPCSVRAIKSWLTDVSNPSSRSCPDWVVPLLKIALETRNSTPESPNRGLECVIIV